MKKVQLKVWSKAGETSVKLYFYSESATQHKNVSNVLNERQLDDPTAVKR